jgi:hypothetical protein
MSQRGKIKSFGVLKTATIGGIVTAALIAVPMAFILALFAFFHVFPHSTHNTGATPSGVVQPKTAATPNPCAQPNQQADNKHPRPFRARDQLAIFAIFPLVYGIFGFLLFGAWSWLYNILSPRFGGIEIDWSDGPEE